MRTAAEVLDGAELPAGTVAVWDPIGGPIGISVAELLAPDRSVVLITPDNIAGNELSRSGDLATANARLQQAGVDIQRRTLVVKAKKGALDVVDRFSGEQRTIRASVVVDAGHRASRRAVRRSPRVARLGSRGRRRGAAHDGRSHPGRSTRWGGPTGHRRARGSLSPIGSAARLAGLTWVSWR